MKGFRRFLSPFTPDQSGATSVFYGYKGMTIMLDAGGCIGNTCGFDEPRWKDKPGAIFSAALRDLDVILGSDEFLIKKIRKAIDICDAEFIVLIGTPVTAIIGTDYKALTRLMEQEFGIPILSVDTDGMELYDAGIERAYIELFRSFSLADEANVEVEKNASRIGVIGALPLDTYAQNISMLKEAIVRENEHDETNLEIVCYGNGDSIRDIMTAGNNLKNIVVSPAGIKGAKYLERKFGTPYEARYPLDEKIKELIEEMLLQSGALDRDNPKVLIVHQQFFANSIREFLRHKFAFEHVSIGVATWFTMNKDYAEEGDFRLKEESDLRELVRKNSYNVIMGDPLFKRLLYDVNLEFVSLPHFAISGALHEVREY